MSACGSIGIKVFTVRITVSSFATEMCRQTIIIIIIITIITTTTTTTVKQNNTQTVVHDSNICN
jgi:hypothetical protein